MTKKNKHIENNYQELSILASSYGLSFMLKGEDDTAQKFFEYTFEVTNPFVLSNKLIEIFIERNLTEYSFDKINLTHHNLLNTLVPVELFNPENASYFLDKNIKLLPNDEVIYDILKDKGIVNIYVAFSRLIKFLSSKTDRLISRHSASVFLEKIAGERKSELQFPVFEIYLNVFQKDFQIAVFKNEKLQLYNAFPYENTDEFLYYLFFVWETLEIPHEKMHIYLSGIEPKNEIVKNLSDFTANYTVLPAATRSSINDYITG